MIECILRATKHSRNDKDSSKMYKHERATIKKKSPLSITQIKGHIQAFRSHKNSIVFCNALRIMLNCQPFYCDIAQDLI